LDVYIKKIKMIPTVDVKAIARGTPGFSGADLANLVNEAALLAARANKNIVTQKEFEDAKDKILMGTARKTAMKDEERKLTAYHESGHALVGISMPASDPIHKATIIPRGRALGMVVRLPEGDRFSMTREKMYADLAVAMAGRVAEEIIFGVDRVTSGASSDIEQATKLARAMVIKWGLSDKVGMINYGNDKKEFSTQVYSSSEKTAELIDSEVKMLVDDSYILAKKILTEKLDSLHKLANALLEFETLSGEEINDLMAGKDISRVVEEPTKRGSILSDA
jgi:cell division protease FtsH